MSESDLATERGEHGVKAYNVAFADEAPHRFGGFIS